MSLLWLRVALGCYWVGLLYAFVALTRTSDLSTKSRCTPPTWGWSFNSSRSPKLFLSGPVVSASVHNSESLLAFLSMAFS